MLGGRSGKRPGDDDEPPGQVSPKTKLARLERRTEDFSNVVKSRLAQYTRTGQACDRCKVRAQHATIANLHRNCSRAERYADHSLTNRSPCQVRKIRCDGLPDGCSHCMNSNLECYVTDRVTGRTERRGYMKELELEKQSMLTRIDDLERLLRDNGVEVRPVDQRYQGYFDDAGAAQPEVEGWTRSGSVYVKKNPQMAAGALAGRVPRAFLEARPADSHLGIGSADNAPLSSFKGTKLSILGTTIDITSFDAPDIDEPAPDAKASQPLYNKSVQAFLQSTMNINPHLDDITLPARKEGFTYSEWYFLMIFPFLPILHKPTYMKLVSVSTIPVALRS
jgi:hypothetical protein